MDPLRTDPMRPGVARQDATDHGQIGERGHQPHGSGSAGHEKSGPNQDRFAGSYRKGETGLLQAKQRADGGDGRGHRASSRAMVSGEPHALPRPHCQAQRVERPRTKPNSQSATSTMIAIQIRLTRPPAAWNSNHSTKRMTAITSNAWIETANQAKGESKDCTTIRLIRATIVHVQ